MVGERERERREDGAAPADSGKKHQGRIKKKRCIQGAFKEKRLESRGCIGERDLNSGLE